MSEFDVGIIGGGPAGYAAGIRAVQNGLSVVLFEKECMGGVCLNRGCIPTKTILRSTDFYKSLKKAPKFGIDIANAKIDYSKVIERKNAVCEKIVKNLEKLVESYKIQIVKSEAVISTENTITAGNKTYFCKNIIIATGSKPAQIKGIETDGDFIVNSDELLLKSNLPQKILIIGSGAIGCEWARIFSALEKEITIVEICEKLLPQADEEVSDRLERLFKKDKIKFYKNTRAEKIEGKKVTFSNSEEAEFDLILCAAGREAVLPESENFEFDKVKGFIKTDSNFKTNFDSVFAIGDVNGKSMLAHAAFHQAIMAVDFISGKEVCGFDALKVPCVVFGTPEIAWAGKTEKMLEGTDYKKYKFPLSALGKAWADDEIDGFVKVLCVNRKLAGAHIISPEASSLIQQFALLIDNEIEISKILKTVFAHPTYSEGVFEAAAGLEGLSLSMPGGFQC